MDIKDRWNRTITFDSFIKGCLIVLLVVGLIMLLRRLSSVLLPFFIGWLIAYLMNPLVNFFQKKCRLKYRILGIVAAFIVVGGVLYGAFLMIFPPMWQEILKVKDMLVNYLMNNYETGGFSAMVHDFLAELLSVDKLKSVFTIDGLVNVLKESMPRIWEFLTGSFKAFSGIVTIAMVLLYTLFILIDYDRLARGYKELLPERIRKPFTQLMNDLESGMNKYFKGQALIALCVGILFSIGFLIIDFPLAVALGLFIGLLNMVPYLQLVGFIPTIALAAVKAANTGESFWLIMLSALAVFAVVQTIQDVVLTPKIMGKVSGLNSAIILLSLSIWGSLLGIMGMIIAIPMTTLLITYYQRYVVKIPNNPTAQAGPPSYTPEREDPLDSQNPEDDDSSPMDAR
ncbi:MAG: AI-2E family transporter [Bacteroidales bacterium]|nr:AI-2E family transporter [Bacteroidales bacterium]